MVKKLSQSFCNNFKYLTKYSRKQVSDEIKKSRRTVGSNPIFFNKNKKIQCGL
jgi:mRNA-degrading endonuclease RelE of RelBE toxin-antitoxin system